MFLGRYQLGLFIEERQYLIVEGLIVIHFAEHSMSCPMYEVQLRALRQLLHCLMTALQFYIAVDIAGHNAHWHLNLVRMYEPAFAAAHELAETTIRPTVTAVVVEHMITPYADYFRLYRIVIHFIFTAGHMLEYQYHV